MTCWTLGDILCLMPHWAFLLGTFQMTELLCFLDSLKIYSGSKTVCEFTALKTLSGLAVRFELHRWFLQFFSHCYQSHSGGVNQTWIKNWWDFVNQQWIWWCMKELSWGRNYLQPWLSWLFGCADLSVCYLKFGRFFRKYADSSTSSSK